MGNRVTVVIPCYNAGKYLEKAVESVICQSCKEWELIIIDDASTDGCIAKINKYLSDPRIRVAASDTNMGPAISLNKALDMFKTPYMLQLDADDMLLPHTIETLLKAAQEAEANVALISACTRIIFEGSDGNVKRSVIFKSRPYKNKLEFLFGNHFMIPRFYRVDALKHVGGWPIDDPFHGRYTEDWGILFRLIEKFCFQVVDDILYVYRKHEGSMLDENLTVFNNAARYVMENTLERWGLSRKYKPVFKVNQNGFIILEKLVSKSGMHITARNFRSINLE